MGKLKEKYLNNYRNSHSDMIDVESTYPDWELVELNESIKLKYSFVDIKEVLNSIELTTELKNQILQKLDILYSEKNGFL